MRPERAVHVPRVGAAVPATKALTGQAGAWEAPLAECQQEHSEHYEVLTLVTALQAVLSLLNISTPELTSIFYLATQ